VDTAVLHDAAEAPQRGPATGLVVIGEPIQVALNRER
jgi:hypothetical protein